MDTLDKINKLAKIKSAIKHEGISTEYYEYWITEYGENYTQKELKELEELMYENENETDNYTYRRMCLL